MSGGVEWALHCCVVLTSTEAPVPAARLAQFHDVSPTYLAKQLQALSRAGLVRSVQGKSGGYVLTRSPASITVLDVVEAIDGPDPAFVCTEIRQRGPMATPREACTAPCPISRTMAAAESARRNALRSVTIADLAGDVESDSGAGTLAGVGTWLTSSETQRD
ncbi:RrF2 family transcriptional regulator [Streptomyces xylophagus]|uniref:RrF2 family transcriptional regulator n=1 Tax=Streptomyces xylophagus TaxID=285514 RepID=UPI0005BAEF20|nr:Rrf2 family transcriptional regulator [Streptomyces xylophagus]